MPIFAEMVVTVDNVFFLVKQKRTFNPITAKIKKFSRKFFFKYAHNSLNLERDVMSPVR